MASIIGYEIHAGETLVDLQQPISINTDSHDKKYDGALSDDGMIFGTYCHGIFDSPQAFEHILEWAGVSDLQQINSREQQQIKSLDRLADSIEQDLNLALLWPELFS